MASASELFKVRNKALEVAFNDAVSSLGETEVQGAIDAIAALALALSNGKKDDFSENEAFNRNFGTGNGSVCRGNDSRLTDSRTPTTHTHSWGQTTGKPTTFTPTIGSSGSQAVAGNDSRLTNSRTPLSHDHTSSASVRGLTKRPSYQKSANGYFRDNESGVIFQWGILANVQTGVINLPTAFPSLCAVAVCSQLYNSTAEKFAPRVRSKTTSQLSLHWGNDYVSGADLQWFAIGY